MGCIEQEIISCDAAGTGVAELVWGTIFQLGCLQLSSITLRLGASKLLKKNLVMPNHSS